MTKRTAGRVGGPTSDGMAKGRGSVKNFDYSKGQRDTGKRSGGIGTAGNKMGEVVRKGRQGKKRV